MILHVEGLKVPEELEICVFYNRGDKANPDYDGPWQNFNLVPERLVPLGDAPWPEDVKAEIVKTFMAIGLESPLRQKLVDPYAVSFGGKSREGEFKIEGVNWPKVKDYFKYEAMSMIQENKTTAALQKEAVEKYGHIFNHKDAYGDDY